MAKSKPQELDDSAEAVKELNTLISNMTEMISPALKTIAQFQEHRASRLQEGLAHLEDSIGKDHRDYRAVKDALDRSVQLSSHLKTQVSRLEKWPKPRAFEWLVYGQVLDTDGEPAEGLHVRAFDRDRKYDDLLGETETDSNGDFAILYHERDFAEVGENLPELFVMVSDQDGETLYSSRDQVRFEAGKSEYFLIQLSEYSKVSKESKTTRRQSKRSRKNRDE